MAYISTVIKRDGDPSAGIVGAEARWVGCEGRTRRRVVGGVDQIGMLGQSQKEDQAPLTVSRVGLCWEEVSREPKRGRIGAVTISHASS